MKQFIFSLFSFLLTGQLSAQNIKAAEYFFNTDPGIGAAKSLPVSTPSNTVSFNATIPTTSLNPGMHLLAVRVQNAAGQWSLMESRTVYISSAQTVTTAITGAEFFIDNDPGLGAGTGLGISMPGHSVQFNAVIPVASLSPGFHTLAVRTRNANNEWSLFESRGFYISHAANNAVSINAAEYFIDTDPGVGNGTALPVGTSGPTLSLTAMIPTATLTAGFHTIGIRVKNNKSEWSHFETRSFYIQPIAGTMGAIAEAEYFVDSDPGVGNGTRLTIPTPGHSVAQNYLIEIPRSTPNGKHWLAVRVKDANGIWSLFDVKEFDVAGYPLPLDWLSFTGQRRSNSVNLQWTTANERGTSHFEVERSINGVQYTRIGNVTANGAAQNAYSFDDGAPISGLNYYRLKQVDRDGSHQYSAVVKVYFGSGSTTELKLFPQPATTDLNIVFGGTGRQVFVQVYDAAGKLVMNLKKDNTSPIPLSIDQLSKGTYWIVLSDGITMQKGQFIRQ